MMYEGQMYDVRSTKDKKISEVRASLIFWGGNEVSTG